MLRASGRNIITTPQDIIEARRKSWQDELAVSQDNSDKPIHPARLLKELVKQLPNDAIVVTDVGWNKNGAG
jgi:acetolactate synthase-1/2/3 large subunit